MDALVKQATSCPVENLHYTKIVCQVKIITNYTLLSQADTRNLNPGNFFKGFKTEQFTKRFCIAAFK